MHHRKPAVVVVTVMMIVFVIGDTPLHIAAARGKADVIQALTTTLTKPEVKHPYYRVPYKSLPQDNVQSCNHDGRAPVHLAAQVAHSQPHLEALVALAKYARADMDYRVSFYSSPFHSKLYIYVGQAIRMYAIHEVLRLFCRGEYPNYIEPEKVKVEINPQTVYKFHQFYS